MMRRQQGTRLLGLWTVVVLAIGAAGCAPVARDRGKLLGDQVEAAVNAYAEGNRRAANRLLNDAVRAAGGSSAAYTAVAELLTEEGRPAEAAELLRRGAEKPEVGWDPVLWAALGAAAARAGNEAQAGRANAEAALRARQIMDTIGDDGAAQRGKGAWKIPAVQRFLQAGFYYHESKDTPAALRAWREAVRREPDNPAALNALGYTLADEGTTREEFEEALLLTRKAARLAPGEPAILDSYGWALYKMGDLKSARRLLREAVDAAPENAELHYHMGVIYGELEMYEEAENALARALRLRPDYAEAKRAKEQLPKLNSVRRA